MVAALLLFLLADILLVIAWRGRPVDDHPLCRKCNFDLTGRPETSARCPECGADVTAAHSTRTGHRARSPGAVFSALVLLAISALWLAIELSRIDDRVNFNRFKPSWLLAADARAGRDRPLALKELLSRLHAGSIKATDLAPLIDQILAIQKDPMATWDTTWGTFVEEAETRGAVRPDQMARYARQAITLVALTPRSDPSSSNVARATFYGVSFDLHYRFRAGFRSYLRADQAGMLKSADHLFTASGGQTIGNLTSASSFNVIGNLKGTTPWSVSLPLAAVTIPAPGARPIFPPGPLDATAIIDLTIRPQWGGAFAPQTVRYTFPVQWSHHDAHGPPVPPMPAPLEY